MELFETFDDAGKPTGLVPRDEVHRKGLWHRAANVFVFNPTGELLLQQRSAEKDVWPDAWDLSAAEHLTPGESYLEGALRGLREELGINGMPLTPLGSEMRAEVVVRPLGILDRELQRSFQGQWGGSIRPCPEEVAAVRWVSLDALTREIAADPERFTPWLRSRLKLLSV